MFNKCQYNCNLQTPDGYCKVTACINPEHNGSGTYIVDCDALEKIKMQRDPDYGRGIYS